MRTLGLDTETMGLDAFHGCQVFSLAAADGDLERTWYWQFEVDPFTRKVTIPKQAIKQIQSLIDEYDEIVFHNAAFDWVMLYKMGIKVPWRKVRDTFIQSHVLYSIGPHGLKYLRIKHLDMPLTEEEELGKVVNSLRRKAEKKGYNLAGPDNPMTPSSKTSKWKGDMWLIVVLGTKEDQQVLQEYNEADAMDCWTLHRMMQEEIQRRGHEAQVEWRMESLRTAISMKLNGVTLSKDAVREAWGRFRQIQKEQEAICSRISDANLGSPQQLQVLFFKDWDLPRTKRTDGGGFSTDANAIEFLLEQKLTDEQQDFLLAFQTYSKATTALGYIKEYIRYSVPVPGHPDFIRIHSNFNVIGTAWIRMSSSNPNQQNVSKKKEFNLRSIYAPLPGKVWYAFDQNNIELRIFAWDSGDQNLIDAFLQGKSMHMVFARLLYAKELAAVDDDDERFKSEYEDSYYQNTKNGTFLLIYGGGEKKGDRTYGVKGAYKRIRREMPLIDVYLSKFQREAESCGYISTMGGYRLYVSPESPHKASNGRVQGTAAEILQKGADRLWQWLRDNHPCCRIILNIHDELVVEAPEDYPLPLEEVARVMMDTGLHFPTPVSCNKITKNWSEKESIPLAL